MGIPVGWRKRYVDPFKRITFFSRIKLAFSPTLSPCKSLSWNQVPLCSHDIPIGPSPSYLSNWTRPEHCQRQE